jgi:hypothetical protein
MIIRQRHWLLRLMGMRAVVNNHHLYELAEAAPVAIPFADAAVTLMVTNGFHASEPLQLTFEPGSTYFFQVNALVNNTGLAFILLASLAFFALYVLNGSGLLLIAANLPILALVWIFFLQPKRAILLKPWQPKEVP